LDRQTFARLKQADWDSMYPVLIAHARWRGRRYSWHGGAHLDSLPKGNQLDDIVQLVIAKTFAGDRKWEPERGELLPWLKMQIDSEINALVKSAAHRNEEHEPEASEEYCRDGTYNEPEDFFGPDPCLTPEGALLEAEYERSNRNMLFEAAGNDQELVEIVEAVIGGCDFKASALAEELQVPVTDVYNRIRRLKRHCRTQLEGLK